MPKVGSELCGVPTPLTLAPEVPEFLQTCAASCQTKPAKLQQETITAPNQTYLGRVSQDFLLQVFSYLPQVRLNDYFVDTKPVT